MIRKDQAERQTACSNPERKTLSEHHGQARNNPFLVIQAEDRILVDGQFTAPHADPGSLKALACLKPRCVTAFTAHNLFSVALTNGPALRAHLNELTQTIVKGIASLRATIDHAATTRPSLSPALQHGTRYILRELVRGFLIDRQKKVTRNDAVDLMHAVVPVAYADFVALDKHWSTQVEKVQRWASDAGLGISLASVFSKREGLDDLISMLETS